MYLHPQWTDKENSARKRINSESSGGRVPRINRTRLQSDSGRPVFNDLSNNSRLPNNVASQPNQVRPKISCRCSPQQIFLKPRDKLPARRDVKQQPICDKPPIKATPSPAALPKVKQSIITTKLKNNPSPQTKSTVRKTVEEKSGIEKKISKPLTQIKNVTPKNITSNQRKIITPTPLTRNPVVLKKTPTLPTKVGPNSSNQKKTMTHVNKAASQNKGATPKILTKTSTQINKPKHAHSTPSPLPPTKLNKKPKIGNLSKAKANMPLIKSPIVPKISITKNAVTPLTQDTLKTPENLFKHEISPLAPKAKKKINFYGGNTPIEIEAIANNQANFDSLMISYSVDYWGAPNNSQMDSTITSKECTALKDGERLTAVGNNECFSGDSEISTFPEEPFPLISIIQEHIISRGADDKGFNGKSPIKQQETQRSSSVGCFEENGHPINYESPKQTNKKIFLSRRILMISPSKDQELVITESMRQDGIYQEFTDNDSNDKNILYSSQTLIISPETKETPGISFKKETVFCSTQDLMVSPVKQKRVAFAESILQEESQNDMDSNVSFSSSRELYISENPPNLAAGEELKLPHVDSTTTDHSRIFLVLKEPSGLQKNIPKQPDFASSHEEEFTAQITASTSVKPCTIMVKPKLLTRSTTNESKTVKMKCTLLVNLEVDESLKNLYNFNKIINSISPYIEFRVKKYDLSEIEACLIIESALNRLIQSPVITEEESKQEHRFEEAAVSDCATALDSAIKIESADETFQFCTQDGDIYSCKTEITNFQDYREKNSSRAHAITNSEAGTKFSDGKTVRFSENTSDDSAYKKRYSEVESITDETFSLSEINDDNITFAATQFLRKLEPTSKQIGTNRTSSTNDDISSSHRRSSSQQINIESGGSKTRNSSSKGAVSVSAKLVSGRSRDISPVDKASIVTERMPGIVENSFLEMDDGDGVDFRTGHQAILDFRMRTHISPIKPNLFKAGHNHLRNDIKTQKKMTLAKKTRISRYNEASSYCLNIFTPEYINDIILNSLMVEYKFKLKRNFYLEHNPCLENRTRILNWLLTLEDDLHMTNAMYYMTTHLFDVVLSKLFIPNNMYQLVIVTIAWLITKYNGTKMLSAPKLVRLCDNAYSQKQLLDMELKMLRIFQFSFHAPDPILFVNYYLYKMNVNSDHQIVYTTYYIMESFTLSPLFSTYESSKIAAAALYLCLTSLYPGQEIYQRIQYVRGYYSPSKLVDLVKIMLQHLKAITSNHYVKMIFSKYSTREMKFVSIRFAKYIS